MTKRNTDKCGAKKKNGDFCELDAGWGTDHTGSGPCKFHGGSTPNAILNAARAKATVMGVAIDVSPHEALLQCIRIMAGQVMYCNEMISQLSPEDALGHPMEYVERDGYTSEEGRVSYEETRKKVPMMNIWIRTRDTSLDRLAKFSKMALDAGVNERRVQVAEGLAGALAPALRAMFNDLGLTERQKKIAPELLQKAMLTLEGEVMDASPLVDEQQAAA